MKTIIFIGLISIIISLWSKGYTATTIINHYLDYRYQIGQTIELYTQHPLDDLQFRIPMLYESDLRFPDLNESVNIQLHGRLDTLEGSLVDIVIELQEGQSSKYQQGAYDRSIMFAELKLYDMNAMYIDSNKPFGNLLYTLETVSSNDLPYFATQFIIDNIFIDEFQMYYPGNFFQFDTDSGFVLESRNGLHNSKVRDVLNGLINDIVINIYMVGSDYELDIHSLISSSIVPPLKGVEDLYNIIFRIHHIESDIDAAAMADEIEGVEEPISALPYLSNIINHQINTDNDIRLIFYPYNLIPNLEELTYREENFHQEGSDRIIELARYNTTLFLSDAPFGGDKVVGETEFEHVITRNLMNALGSKGEELSFELRLESFKRLLITNALTRFSNILGTDFLSALLTKGFYGIYDTKALETLAYTLEKRGRVVELARTNEIDEALRLSLDILKDLRDYLG